MTEIVVIKAAGGMLIPADQPAADYIAGLKLGAAVRAKVTKMNNPAFHRKLMALFNLGFDTWEPGELEYKGQKVAKSFDQFRGDITILAGYYEASVNFKGEVRLMPKSLSFGKMDHDEREALYNAVVDVLLQRVLTQYTRDDLDNVIAQLMSFT